MEGHKVKGEKTGEKEIICFKQKTVQQESKILFWIKWMPLSAAFFYPGPNLCLTINKITQLKACIFLHSQIHTHVAAIPRVKKNHQINHPKPNEKKTNQICHLFLEVKLVAWVSMVKWGKLYIHDWFEVWMNYQKYLQIYFPFISYAVAFLCFQEVRCLRSTCLHNDTE